MSYNVKVRHTADSGDGISVEAKVNGEPVAHTFPKEMGFFEEPAGNKNPPYVDKLIEKYEEKVKREGKLAQTALSAEERKIHNSKFENRTYNENFKEGNNQNSNMVEVDTSDPEQVREYLKENMAEGYLSEEEGLNIDRFVNRYKEMMENNSNTEKYQDIIRKVYEEKVQ